MLLNKTGLRGVPGQFFSAPSANSIEAGERKRKSLRFNGRMAMPLPERKKDKNYTYQDYLTWPDAEFGNIGLFIRMMNWWIAFYWKTIRSRGRIRSTGMK
jgi:hypothetical protein